MKKIMILVFALTLGILSTGCDKDVPVPELPPPASFILEIDKIWKNSPAQNSNYEEVSHSNFIFAASNIYWWNIILSYQMAIPVAAFLESFNHEPVWDKDANSWVWSYTIDVQNASYTAELFAESSSTEIDWSMYISKTDGYSDLLWFSGTSEKDNSSGTWIINSDPDYFSKYPDTSLPFIGIDWKIDQNSHSEITYKNIQEGTADYGNYIRYGTINDPDLDVYYDIYKNWEDDEVNIKWNSSKHHGKVLSMTHFDNPYWHCWNDQLQNIACD